MYIEKFDLAADWLGGWGGFLPPKFENSGFDLDAELLTAFLKSLAGVGRADVFMYVWTVSKFSLVLIFPMATHSRRFLGGRGLCLVLDEFFLLEADIRDHFFYFFCIT